MNIKKTSSILAVIALITAACTKDKLTKPQPEQTARTFTLTHPPPSAAITVTRKPGLP